MLVVRPLTEQGTQEDEDLDGCGEVPVGLLPDDALLLLQRWAGARDAAAAAAAAVPAARRVQRLQLQTRQVGCTVRHHGTATPAIHGEKGKKKTYQAMLQSRSRRQAARAHSCLQAHNVLSAKAMGSMVRCSCMQVQMRCRNQIRARCSSYIKITRCRESNPIRLGENWEYDGRERQLLVWEACDWIFQWVRCKTAERMAPPLLMAPTNSAESYEW